jgi:hypothetical protein
MTSKIKERCEEFHKSINVDKNYPFSLRDRYFTDKGELTFEDVYLAGARAVLEEAEKLVGENPHNLFDGEWRNKRELLKGMRTLFTEEHEPTNT